MPGLSFQTEVENQSDDGWTAGEPSLASSALPSVLQLIVLLSFLSLVSEGRLAVQLRGIKIIIKIIIIVIIIIMVDWKAHCLCGMLSGVKGKKLQRYVLEFISGFHMASTKFKLADYRFF